MEWYFVGDEWIFDDDDDDDVIVCEGVDDL